MCSSSASTVPQILQITTLGLYRTIVLKMEKICIQIAPESKPVLLKGQLDTVVSSDHKRIKPELKNSKISNIWKLNNKLLTSTVKRGCLKGN